MDPVNPSSDLPQTSGTPPRTICMHEDHRPNHQTHLHLDNAVDNSSSRAITVGNKRPLEFVLNNNTPFETSTRRRRENKTLEQVIDDPSIFEGLEDIITLPPLTDDPHHFLDAWDLPPQDFEDLKCYFDEDNNPRLHISKQALERILRDVMGACDQLTLSIDKKITNSDMHPVQNRFAMPTGQTNLSILSAHEMTRLESKEKEEKNIKVKLVILNFQKRPPELECPHPLPDLLAKDGEEKSNYHTINFTKWKGMYVLNWDVWATVIQHHNLVKDMRVVVWTFRVGDELCFAMVKSHPLEG